MFWKKEKKEKEYLVIATNLQGKPAVFTTEEMPLYGDELFCLKKRVFNETRITYCSVEELLEKFEQIIFIYNDSFTRTFCKEDVQDNVTEELNKNNLLEIKLKDTDSVPEVYYKGQRMDEMPRGLIDITYHWHTEDDEYQVSRGVNDITIEYYDSPNNKYLDRKIIGHKRDM